MENKNSFPNQILTAMTSVSVLVGIFMLSFEFMFVVGLIWAAVGSVIARHTQDRFHQSFAIISFIIVLIGAFSMFMESR